jgi:hypothetical protein
MRAKQIPAAVVNVPKTRALLGRRLTALSGFRHELDTFITITGSVDLQSDATGVVAKLSELSVVNNSCNQGSWA